MKIFNKIVIILISLFWVFNSLIFIVTAETPAPTNTDDYSQLEIVYPSLSIYTTPPETTRAFLPEYIKYIYTFAVFASAIIAFFCLLIGGVRFLTSVGNPSVMQDAREQIFSGIIGMVVILGSYLILKELNPDLTSFSLPNIELVSKGIILYSDTNCGNGEANGEPYKVNLEKMDPKVNFLRVGDTKTNLAAGKDKEFWEINSFWSFQTGREFNVQFFEKGDCSGNPKYDGVSANMIKGCNPNPSGDGLRLNGINCVKIVWRNPGIWVFNYENGNPLNPTGILGESYANYQISQESIKEKLRGNIRSIALVKSETDFYGAIIHNKDSGIGGANRGWSEILIPSSEYEITRFNLTEKERGVESITIFRIPEPTTEAVNMEDEFTLYREVGKKMMDDEKEVVPQLRIKWPTAPVAGAAASIGTAITNSRDLLFEDITNDICKTRSGVAANFDNAMNNIWKTEGGDGKICGTGFNNVVGGIRLNNRPWFRDDGTEVKLKTGNTLRAVTGDGVSGFYAPSSSKYISLLYDKDIPPIDAAVRSSTDIWSSAAVIYGSYSDLSAVEWEDKLLTLVVVREK